MKTSNKKQICFIAEADGWGGAEMHTLELIKYLVSKDYYIEYISCKDNIFVDDYTRMNPKRIKIIRTNLSIFDDSTESRYLWLQFLRQIKSRTLVFAHLSHDHGNLIFFRSCRNFFKKVYFIEHTSPPPMEPKMSSRYFFGLIKGLDLEWYKTILKRKRYSIYANKIIAVSDEARAKFIKDWAYPTQKIFTVRNGINWRRFSSIPTSKNELKKKYHIPQDAKVFGVLGRLSHEKGVDMAIESFHLLMSKNPNAKAFLVIVGKGIEEKLLKKITRDHNIEDKVIFTGFLEKPDEILPLFDIILSSSRREGLPLALLEAMSAGCLPIIFKIGGMPEVITHPDLGWVIKPNNTSRFAQAMEEALHCLDEDNISKRKEKILEHIKKNFDDEKSYEKIIDVLNLKSAR